LSSDFSPFDSLAAQYDETFTNTAIGQLMRTAVWRHVDRLFSPGDCVLELNCGTGEDALHLARRGVRVVATDVSPEMLAVAREKVGAAGLTDKVVFHRLDLAAGEEEFSGLAGRFGSGAERGKFDGAFSNFGGLNCVADPAVVARGLSGTVRAGGSVAMCVMGKLVPWEWIWYAVRGRFSKAVRRLRPGGVEWRGLNVRYHSIGALRIAFAPAFRLLRTSGIGFLVPPPYAEDFAGRHPRALQALNRWERRLETTRPFPWLADHYLVELERTNTA
jgi:SAM-dependent methyltransferase